MMAWLNVSRMNTYNTFRAGAITQIWSPVLGLTFKENVPQMRNSKVCDIVREFRSAGVTVQVHDPLAHAEDGAKEYGIRLIPAAELKPAAAIVLAVAHDFYVTSGWPLVQRLLRDGRGFVIDVKAKLERSNLPAGK